MENRVGLAKSAHMLGISRRELQELIRNGDLQTFEGCVDLEALRQRFPSLALDEGSFIERLTFLQETAFSRRVRETVLPDKQDLAAAMRKRNADYAVERARAEKYCAILRDLDAKVAALQCGAGAETKQALEELNRWLLSRLESSE